MALLVRGLSVPLISQAHGAFPLTTGHTKAAHLQAKPLAPPTYRHGSAPADMCIARTPSTTEFGFTPDNKTEAGTPRLRPLSLSPQRHERIFLQLSVPRRPRCHCLSWAKSEVSRTTSGLLHPCFLDSILSRSCGLLIRYRHMCRCGNAMVCMRLNTLSDMHGFDVCISISSAGLGLDCNAKFLSGLVPDRLVGLASVKWLMVVE